MKIGYCRCTIDQNTARQEQILKNLGCERIYTDMISGKNRDRPGMQEMMGYIRVLAPGGNGQKVPGETGQYAPDETGQ